jgi:hypothetical protein
MGNEFSFGFDRIQDHLKKLSPKIQSTVALAVMWAAIETEGWLKDAIEQQRLGHTPLTEKYLRWKRRHGLDERILIARHEDNYYQSIKARAIGQFSWTVGPSPEFQELGMWLEFGTRTMPARPHLSVAKGVALQLLRRKLREMGFHVDRR